MARLLSILLWTAVFLLIVLAADQLLVRVPASLPAHVAAADFYRDLRGRVLALAGGTKPAPTPGAAPAKPAPLAGPQPKGGPVSVEAIIEQRRAGAAVPVRAAAPTRAAAAKPAPPAVTGKPAAGRAAPDEAKPRYVYADAAGALHFADTLAEVPEEYRGKAKLLGR
ncbi:MAG: hypothetical protein FDZ69_05795 [Deltaproteobacteria bacterium]|nr:MAG: hypothetical protein FDZ69_05795 [Deltaproteobacteria bacterium]